MTLRPTIVKSLCVAQSPAGDRILGFALLLEGGTAVTRNSESSPSPDSCIPQSRSLHTPHTALLHSFSVLLFYVRLLGARRVVGKDDGVRVAQHGKRAPLHCRYIVRFGPVSTSSYRVRHEIPYLTVETITRSASSWPDPLLPALLQ